MSSDLLVALLKVMKQELKNQKGLRRDFEQSFEEAKAEFKWMLEPDRAATQLRRYLVHFRGEDPIIYFRPEFAKAILSLVNDIVPNVLLLVKALEDQRDYLYGILSETATEFLNTEQRYFECAAIAAHAHGKEKLALGALDQIKESKKLKDKFYSEAIADLDSEEARSSSAAGVKPVIEDDDHDLEFGEPI